MARPKKLKRAGSDPGAAHNEVQTLNTKGTDIPALNWVIPSVYEDGVKIRVENRRVFIFQTRLMQHEESVELSLREARRLLEILPLALRAAERHKEDLRA